MEDNTPIGNKRKQPLSIIQHLQNLENNDNTIKKFRQDKEFEKAIEK